MATDCHPRVTLYLVLNNSKDGKETLKPAVKQVSSGIFKNVARFVENFKTPFLICFMKLLIFIKRLKAFKDTTNLN